MVPGTSVTRALLLVFALSRALYYAAGVRFDARPLDRFFQFIDPQLLRHRLLESLYYFHIQPPGFNLFAGLVLKLFPVYYASAFHAVYLFCGVVIMLSPFHSASGGPWPWRFRSTERHQSPQRRPASRRRRCETCLPD